MKTPLIIKFGGTSVSSKESLQAIIEIVKNSRNRMPVLVVSAVTGITDALLALSKIQFPEIEAEISKIFDKHEKLVLEFFSDTKAQKETLKYISLQLDKVKNIVKKQQFTPEIMDTLVSYGETLSSYIVSRALQSSGINSKQIIASSMIVTNDSFTHAEFMPDETEIKVKKILISLYKKGIVPVVTGFIGATGNGKITTLGRGGSDYSASIIAYSLHAAELQIWTDVSGIYTADPRVVKNAMLISTISYKEAAEMATFGAKVLHPKTIRPAVQRNIPVRVLNTFNPAHSGTQIISEPTAVGVKAVSFKKKTTVVTIYSTDMLFAPGFLATVFNIFAQQKISIDLVAVSEVSVSVTLDNTANLDIAVRELEKFCLVTVSNDFGLVSLIGEKIASQQHIIKDITELFYKGNISMRMISMGASDINISVVIQTSDVERAVRLIHDQILVRQYLEKNSQQGVFSNLQLSV